MIRKWLQIFSWTFCNQVLRVHEWNWFSHHLWWEVIGLWQEWTVVHCQLKTNWAMCITKKPYLISKYSWGGWLILACPIFRSEFARSRRRCGDAVGSGRHNGIWGEGTGRSGRLIADIVDDNHQWCISFTLWNMSNEIHNLCKTLQLKTEAWSVGSWSNFLVCDRSTEIPLESNRIACLYSQGPSGFVGRLFLFVLCMRRGDGRGPKGYNEDYTDSVIAGWPIVPRLQNVRWSSQIGFSGRGRSMRMMKKGVCPLLISSWSDAHIWF